ncbi:uncharacterized protein CANTADRAFT_307562 [Suhomyces tanzawaensis NRRL Y-17324]|uniref:Mediator of RNA polymerase II transcription subunit 17 n=1 Tax=Suhomyces tanzawaensis NRRL Y-17324 TaxID=984487 RepID=A0A1E4SD97_9ASCO|nr:uncharacterized protein CANTADRAFT_307562 [Suhomyces tanzawaensis NRRL Y-17324]ODV77362.1 hypothetical protein CANTADRAFT_307562 [Suhomyces tanzawaensis NRRL Y-17324]
METHSRIPLFKMNKLTISQLIPRILIERKSFLNITEESLKEEIANPEQESEPSSEVPDTLQEIDSPQVLEDDVLDVFQTQKAELSKNINTALNETSLSLDFVSLLLSSVKPNIAKSTISPHLSKSAPLGSLNADRLSKGEDDDKAAHDEKAKLSTKIGEGWKKESINKITTLFKNSSTTLKDQVLREKNYWNMINIVLSNDEVLFRTRDPLNGSRAIGIKYGYGDSGSNYHVQGSAILRKDNTTGEVTFNPLTSGSNRSQRKVHKYIRIKILSEIDGDYMLTGQSTFIPPTATNSGFSSDSPAQKLLEEIQKARYFLFEEDLFYQLTREAKTLINYNISIISNKIIIEINNEIIEIESVVFDESNEDELTNNYQNINEFSSMHNKKCQLILVYLKLMLCCYYKYNLALKQKIPTAFTKKKQANSHPLILRPMVGNIRYELNIQNMQQILDKLFNKYKKELDVTSELEKYSNMKADDISNPFQKSIERPVSNFKVILRNHKNDFIYKVEIELTTNEIFMNLIINMSIIRFSSSNELEKNLNGLNVLQMSFNDFNDIEECLDWSILKFVHSQ